MPLVAVLVVAITGFAIYRLHGIFGSHTNTSANAGLSNEILPFNPKQLILEVFGAPGAVATINYLDVNAQPAAGRQRAAALDVHHHHKGARRRRKRCGTGQRRHSGLVRVRV
jgi:Mycobacterium membrane protein